MNGVERSRTDDWEVENINSYTCTKLNMACSGDTFRQDKHVPGGPLNRVFGKAAHSSTWIVSAPPMNRNTYFGVSQKKKCTTEVATDCHWVDPILVQKGCKRKFLYQPKQLTLRNRLSRSCGCRRRRRRRHARFCFEEVFVEDEAPPLHRSPHSHGGRTSAPCCCHWLRSLRYLYVCGYGSCFCLFRG